MGNDLNQCTFTGRLGADPEVRYFDDGNAVCNFRIAVGKKYKNKHSGEYVDDTQWIPIVTFRGQAENVSKYLSKGSRVAVTGEWKTREWTDKDNNRRWTTEIVANIGGVIFLDSAKGSRGGGSGGSQTPQDGSEGNQPHQPANGAQASSGAPTKSGSSGGAGTGYQAPDDDGPEEDDIPF